MYYGAEGPDPPQNHVRRTQSHVLRASPSSTVIWPGEYIDIQLPPQNHPDSILALAPHPDCTRSTRNWPHPNIVKAVAVHVRILNDTTEPQHLAHHEYFCQVLPTLTSDVSIVDNTLPPARPPSTPAEPIPLHSSAVQLDPDHILPETNRAAFQQLLHSYDSVFDPSISGYNGAVGPFKAIGNIGPLQPP